MPKRKPTKASKRLAAYFAQQKAKKQLARVKARFKPTKRERDSFVFVDRTGKRRDVNSRAGGFLFYVDKRGRRQLQNPFNKKFPQPQRYRDFDLARSKHEKAKAKWERKFAFHQYGGEVHVSSKQSVGMAPLGRKLRGRLDEFVKKFGTSNVMIVEMTVHTKGKIVRTQFLLTGSELKAFEKGKKGFLPRLAWKAISTELSLEDMVAQTSAAFIAALSGNKRKRKASWTDSRGVRWGKSKFTQVKISRVDIRIKVATKKRLK